MSSFTFCDGVQWAENDKAPVTPQDVFPHLPESAWFLGGSVAVNGDGKDLDYFIDWEELVSFVPLDYYDNPLPPDEQQQFIEGVMNRAGFYVDREAQFYIDSGLLVFNRGYPGERKIQFVVVKEPGMFQKYMEAVIILAQLRHAVGHDLDKWTRVFIHALIHRGDASVAVIQANNFWGKK